MEKRESFAFPLAATLAISFILRALVSFTDLSRLWSLDYLRYFSIPEILIWTIAGIVVLVVANKSSFTTIKKYSSYLVSVLLLALVAVALFYPIETFFYGDGSILVPQIFRLHETGSYDSSLILNLKSAPLTGVTLHFLANSVPVLFSQIETLTYPFIGLSLLAIGILAFVWYTSMRHESDGGVAQMLFLLGAGGTALLLGYVEYYALPYVLIAAYLVAGDAALRNEKPLFPALVLYALAVVAHFMALALLPSVLYLIALRTNLLPARVRSTKSVLLSAGAVLLLWCIVYFAMGFWQADSRIIMPISALTTGAGTQSYTLLSSYHLIDFANVFLLLAPIQIAALLYIAFSSRKAFDTDPSRFYLVAFVFFGTFLFFANTSLGLARDWDIAAALGVILALWAYRVVVSAYPKKNTAALGIGLVAVVYVIPWCIVHLDSDKSVARFERIIQLDDEHIYGDYALSGYEALRKHYLHDVNREKEIAITKRMIELLDYPEHYRLLLNASLPDAETNPAAYLEMQQWMLVRLKQRVEKLQREGVERDYSISKAAIDSLTTSIVYNAVLYNREESLVPTVREICAATGRNNPLNLIAGIRQYAAENYVASIALLRPVLQDALRTEKLYGFVAGALLLVGREAEASAMYEEGLGHFPSGYELPMMYGIALIQSGKHLQAVQYLDLALSNRPPENVRLQLVSIQEQIR